MASAGDLIALARRELLVKEEPSGSNRVKYNTEYYGREVSGSPYPWCVTFLWWLFRQAGAPELFYGGGKTASCSALVSYAKSHGLWVSGTYQPGDLVFLRFSGGVIQHAGLVVENRGKTLLTIEGNTGVGSDANGGQVQQRVRDLSLTAGAYRPAYRAVPAAEPVYRTVKEVPGAYRPLVETLLRADILRGDGSAPAGGEAVVSLTHSQLRMLMLVYRGGGFDRKLSAQGLPPAVPDPSAGKA